VSTVLAAFELKWGGRKRKRKRAIAARADRDVAGGQPAREPGLRVRPDGRRAVLPLPDRDRQLKPRVRRPGGRHLAVGAPGR
jgi:hypothetical protein